MRRDIRRCVTTQPESVQTGAPHSRAVAPVGISFIAWSCLECSLKTFAFLED